MEKNRSKRSISRIMATMLAIVLCLATSMTALAGTGGTQTNPEKAQLTKTLQYADGVGLTTPSVTFTFNFAKGSLDGLSTSADLATMPAIGAETLSFSSLDTPTVVGGMNQISKTSNDVAAQTWTAAGVYEYQVTETASGFTAATGETMNYSLAQYTLYIVVSYDTATSSYFVEQTYTDQTQDNTGGTGGGKGGANPTDTGTTAYNFLFTNTYTKLGGSTPGANALKIAKITTGTGSDQSKQFTYTLTADDSVTGVAPATYTGTITRADATTATVSLTADGTALTFTLANGEEIVFDDLPAGTTFEAEETGAASYIATYTGTTAAGSISSGTGTAGANLSTGTQTIDTINNEVEFTNTYDSSLIPTGVLSNIAPFLALIAVAMVAFVAFAAVSRRKASR